MKKIVKITLSGLLLVAGASFAMQAPKARKVRQASRGPRITQGTPLSQIKFHRAGVMPVTYFFEKDPKTGKRKRVKYVVLAREAYGRDAKTYDAFSGKREKNQKHPVQTASMELWEEGILQDTLGWSQPQALKYIDLNAGNTELILVTDETVLYVTRFTNKIIEKWRSNFYPALRTKKRSCQCKFTEKDRIAVVRWEELKNVINNSSNSMGVKILATVTDPKTKKDCKQREVITLRPILVKELRGLFKF